MFATLLSSTHSASTRSLTGSWLQRRCACGSAGGAAGTCTTCARKKMLGMQPRLTIGPSDAPYEREADAAAANVLAGNNRPALTHLTAPPLQRQDDDKKATPPDPVTEGLSVVGDNLSENNPAFGQFTERLAYHFMAQPAPISVGVPVFLGANYAFLWGMALANPAMRRSFDDFNLALLPGIVPQFPIKTFQYRILDGAQTRFAFDLGLDASKLMEAFNGGVLNTHVSRLSFDTGGRLNTAGSPALSLSALQVNLGLFGDGVLLSGGFRNGISPYPLIGHDTLTGETSRVMTQTPALPDLYTGQRDVRFTVQLDLVKLYEHFHPSTPRGPERLQRQAADAAPIAHDATNAVESTLACAGAPMDRDTRSFMEGRFGHDFGQVRIHADAVAAVSARAVQAHAYTVGNDIVFDSGRYSPSTTEGRRLLAHELAHVVQQGAGHPLYLQRDVNGQAPPRVVPPVTPNRTQQTMIDEARRAAAIRTQQALFRASGIEGDQALRDAMALARIKFDWPNPNMEQISDVLRGMGGGVLTAEVKVAGTGDPECGSRAGYVRGYRPPIVLCPTFFASGTTPESRIRTMVHEMAHLQRIGTTGASESYYPVFDCDSPGMFESADSWANYVHCLSGQTPDSNVVTVTVPSGGATAPSRKGAKP